MLRGAAGQVESLESRPERLRLVLDLTASMGAASTAGEPSPAEAARAAAVRVLEGLPPETDVSLQVLGIATGRACAPPVRLSAPERPWGSQLLARSVAALEPRSEGSLSQALREVRQDVHEAAPASRWRVVVLSDLRSDCGGDPCAGLTGLLELGARVDVVDLGDEPPACLAEMELPGPPSEAAALAPPPPPRFRVEAAPKGGREAGPELARGVAGEAPVGLAAGRAVVVLETDPVFRIGPLDLEPGTLTTVRALDFPAQETSWRAWALSRRPAGPERGTKP